MLKSKLGHCRRYFQATIGYFLKTPARCYVVKKSSTKGRFCYKKGLQHDLWTMALKHFPGIEKNHWKLLEGRNKPV